jgi:50S ribosomal subunit-associated GTPase HflX
VVDVGKYIEKLSSDGIDEFIRQYLVDLLSPIESHSLEDLHKTNTLIVALNKIDLLSPEQHTQLQYLKRPTNQISEISCLKEHGVDVLLDSLKTRLDSL